MDPFSTALNQLIEAVRWFAEALAPLAPLAEAMMAEELKEELKADQEFLLRLGLPLTMFAPGVILTDAFHLDDCWEWPTASAPLRKPPLHPIDNP